MHLCGGRGVDGKETKRYCGSSDRIIAAPGKRMATRYPPKCQQCPPDSAMFGDSLDCILGTGGHKTAGRRKQGGKDVLISSEQYDQATGRQRPPPVKPQYRYGRCIVLLLGYRHRLALGQASIRRNRLAHISGRLLMTHSGRTVRTISAD
jgi:hypothetical protein